jgi:hypothetical protein
MAREYKDLVVGLDIGTAKVMAVVAEVLPDGSLRLATSGAAWYAVGPCMLAALVCHLVDLRRRWRF